MIFEIYPKHSGTLEKVVRFEISSISSYTW